MEYSITHTTQYGYTDAVPVCHNLVHLAPRVLSYQSRDEFRLLVHPEPRLVSYRSDYFGNDVAFFSIDHPHLGLTVTATSKVRVGQRDVTVFGNDAWESVVKHLSVPGDQAMLDVYQYAFSSPSIPRLAALAKYAKPSFSPRRGIVDAVADLTHRIFDDFTYDPRATTVHTPITQVLKDRRGVCQDFAHLQIGCLRALGLAARYVSGYLRTIPPPGKPRLIGADASHAWLSVFCGDAGWIDFDPTNNARAGSDYVTLAWGRDYNDVCPIQGVIAGGGDHKMTVSVDVAPIGV